MRFGSSVRALLLASISPLALLGAVALPGLASAADNEATPSNEISDLTVTFTRRDTTVQASPLNIAAVGGGDLESQGVSTLTEVAALVPGLTVVDQGGRGDSPIIVRGLNANPLASSEALANNGGGTVATYVGEIPFYVHLKMVDMERVEFLLGPQGTLYGAGTLAGAIRYIPNRPQFNSATLNLRGDFYGYAEGKGISFDTGLTFNLPLGDTFAIRGSIDYVNDRGFIDYSRVVRTIGVSDPDPDFGNPAAVNANLMRAEDANTDKTLSGRIGVRWRPSDEFDLNFTYYYQNTDVGGRQISSARGTAPVGQWESNLRVVEPEERTNQLFALEATIDLGFAELTSATGYSDYAESGQRDQTDLLISLEYSYEAFPTFTAFTLDTEDENTFTEELRLVSKSEGPLNWIVGAFYNRFTSHGVSREFTPEYDAFLGTSRPDDLEYISVLDQRLTEGALYGEIGYHFTEQWQVTVGARYYRYKLETAQAADTPLFNTSQGAPPDAIDLVYENGGQNKSGFLYKFNTSYRFTPDVLGYFTISQGYRIGNSNGVPACPVPLPPGQNICGQPNELEYQPDKTTNYELGIHSEWFDRRLRINGDIYYIDWQKPQVLSATLIGLQPITRNAESARSIGFEIAVVAKPTPALTLEATYGYNRAELTAPAPNLVPTYVPPGFQSTVVYLNGEDGDRLPGAPQHKGAIRINYQVEVGSSGTLDFSYGIAAQSSVLSRIGGRGSGFTLDGFAIHSAQVTYVRSDWTATFYVDNIFNEFAETGVRGTPLSNQIVTDSGGGDVHVRTFFTYVAPPRIIGVRVTKRFG